MRRRPDVAGRTPADRDVEVSRIGQHTVLAKPAINAIPVIERRASCAVPARVEKAASYSPAPMPAPITSQLANSPTTPASSQQSEASRKYQVGHRKHAPPAVDVDQATAAGPSSAEEKQAAGESGEYPCRRHAELGGDRVREDSGQIIGRAPGERLRQPEADDDGGGLVQRVACFTASAMLLAADSMASRGSPSTITRSTGSVPDGRSRTRPLPSSKRSTSDCAFLIASCFSLEAARARRSGAPAGTSRAPR